MLTARGQLVDKVLGLKIGADDCLVKPSATKASAAHRDSDSPNLPSLQNVCACLTLTGMRLQNRRLLR
jgi:hypothetical protein